MGLVGRFAAQTALPSLQRHVQPYPAAHVQRRFLTLPGASQAVQLNGHKKAGVWRILQTSNTLLAHVGGAGKIYTLVAAVCLMGPCAPWRFTGAMDGQIYWAWVRRGDPPYSRRIWSSWIIWRRTRCPACRKPLRRRDSRLIVTQKQSSSWTPCRPSRGSARR
jgi:hypothetical protein